MRHTEPDTTLRVALGVTPTATMSPPPLYMVHWSEPDRSPRKAKKAPDPFCKLLCVSMTFLKGC